MSDLNHALFTGISPSALQAPSVSEARAALEAHEAACPGTHLDCYGNPAKERARQAWVDRKALLKSALDLAERCAGQGWREVSPGPAPQPGPQPISIPDPEDTPMPRSKTPEQKLDTMLARLRAYITQGKPRLASTLRSQIRAFCEREGIPCHLLPPNRGKGLGAPEPEAAAPPVHRVERELAERLSLPPEQVHAASAAATHGPRGQSQQDDFLWESSRLLAMSPERASTVTRGDLLAIIRLLVQAGWCFEMTARQAAELPGAHPAVVTGYTIPRAQRLRLVLQKADEILKAVQPHGAVGEVGVGIHGFGAQEAPEALSQAQQGFAADRRGGALPAALLLKIQDQPSGCRVEGCLLSEGVRLGHFVEEFLQDGQGFLGVVHRDSPFFSVSFKRSSAPQVEVKA